MSKKVKIGEKRVCDLFYEIRCFSWWGCGGGEIGEEKLESVIVMINYHGI